MKQKFIAALTLIASFCISELHAITLTVTTNGDSAPTTGGVGSGTSGDLRYVLNYANQNLGASQVVFNLPNGSETIKLNAMLPVLNLNDPNDLKINGSNTLGSGNRVHIDGNSTERAFFAQQGEIRIENLVIQNTLAKGGNGGAIGGGGGLGAGGGLFVNSANVVVRDVVFVSCEAQGGNGDHGATSASLIGGGGGGMGGDGGNCGTGAPLGCGGGGGLGGAGGSSLSALGGGGGGGIAPIGTGGNSSSLGATGGGTALTLSAGSGTTGLTGGASGGGGGGGGTGAYGGGGGDAGNSATSTTAGNGGFGGGGGGGAANSLGNPGGDGGFGGGGGGSVTTAGKGTGGFGGGNGFGVAPAVAGFGGGGGGIATAGPQDQGGVGGGQGANFSVGATGGGGGAAFGGAFFVNGSTAYGEGGGSLVIEGDVLIIDSTLQAGTATSPGATNGAAIGSAILATSGSPLVFDSDFFHTTEIFGTICDDSIDSIPSGNGYTPGNGAGEAIIKRGLGNLILHGVNTYAGGTTIEAGILALRDLGRLNPNGAVTIESDGAFDLSESTNVVNVGDVSNRGRIKLRANTLLVNGSYQQHSRGIYDARFLDFGDSSLIRVQEGATLNAGSRLFCRASEGLPQINIPYQVLTATDGLSGEFTHLASDNPLIRPVATYDNNNAYVTLFINFNDVARTYNQRHVAVQLETIPVNPPPAYEELLQHFAQETEIEARDTLTQMSGVPYTNLILTAELANRQFIRRLFDPLRSILTENPCLPYEYCCYRQTYDVWGAISGGRTFIHGNSNAPGFRIADYEICGGIQSRFTRFLTAGAALSYERDSVSFRNGGGSGTVKHYLGAIYALYRPERFYLLGDFTFGYGNGNIKRRINVGELIYHPRSSQRLYQTSGYVELGTDYGFNKVLLQPFVGLEFGHYRFSGFRESDGFPLALSLSGKCRSSSYTRLGVHITSEPISCGFNMGIDLAWRYRLTSNGNSMNVHFTDFGNPFKIKGLPLQRNSFETILFFSQKVSRHLELYFDAIGEGWDNSFSYSFVGGIKASW